MVIAFALVAEGAGVDSGSSSLSGCSISRSFGDCSTSFGCSVGCSFGVNGFSALAVGGAVVAAAGAGDDFCDEDGAVSDRIGADAGVGAAAGAGVEADLVGVSGIGAEEAETERVSRSMTFGRAFFPPNQSAAERAGSIEAAGGKILPLSSADSRKQGETHSDWKLSDLRGTIKLRGSIDPPASLKPRAISFCATSRARRGRRVRPRSACETELAGA